MNPWTEIDRATNIARWQHLGARCRAIAALRSISDSCRRSLLRTAERYDELTAYTENAHYYEAKLDAVLLPW